MSDVSVVVTTFERPDACERAVRSALGQTVPPREVLICDDGSSQQTVRRLEALAALDARVRVLAAPANTGAPGAGRNRGVVAASGSWIALLDDDDAWLPEKLARQGERLAAGDVDLIGTNALRSGGSLYFRDAPAEWHPRQDDLIRDNPLVLSSVLARRDILLETHGFLTARWARGVADYGMWLALADRGARLCVLGEALVLYEDTEPSRMSGAPKRQEAAVARLFWHRWAATPSDPLALRAAVAKSAAAARLALGRS